MKIGKPQKIKNPSQKQPHGAICHVNFQCVTQATLAICSLNGFRINGYKMVASYGLTRYCKYVL